MPLRVAPLRALCGLGLVGAALLVASRRAARQAELRRLLAGLDGPAPPLTYRELVDTDGDPLPEDGLLTPRALTRPPP